MNFLFEFLEMNIHLTAVLILRIFFQVQLLLPCRERNLRIVVLWHLHFRIQNLKSTVVFLSQSWDLSIIHNCGEVTISIYALLFGCFDSFSLLFKGCGLDVWWCFTSFFLLNIPGCPVIADWSWGLSAISFRSYANSFFADEFNFFLYGWLSSEDVVLFFFLMILTLIEILLFLFFSPESFEFVISFKYKNSAAFFSINSDIILKQSLKEESAIWKTLLNRIVQYSLFIQEQGSFGTTGM